MTERELLDALARDVADLLAHAERITERARPVADSHQPGADSHQQQATIPPADADDAVARVRALGLLLYAERVRRIADEYAGVLSTGAVVTLHHVATRIADIGRALDGEADR